VLAVLLLPIRQRARNGFSAISDCVNIICMFHWRRSFHTQTTHQALKILRPLIDRTSFLASRYRIENSMSRRDVGLRGAVRPRRHVTACGLSGHGVVFVAGTSTTLPSVILGRAITCWRTAPYSLSLIRLLMRGPCRRALLPRAGAAVSLFAAAKALCDRRGLCGFKLAHARLLKRTF
jgi:hypothetical protein